MRPLSWHSEHFNPNDLAAMQLYNGPMSTQQPQHPQQVLAAGAYEVTQAGSNYPWLANGSLHQSLDNLDLGATGVTYPTMVTHAAPQLPVDTSHAMPTHMQTGLSGTKSLDNLFNKQHHFHIKMAS